MSDKRFWLIWAFCVGIASIAFIGVTVGAVAYVLSA